MKKSFFNFVLDQWTPVPAVEIANLEGKIVVIVGANTGIGFEAAKHFARMHPAKLIVACRNDTKGESAVSEIRLATGFECEPWNIDLADFTSVSRFAERFQQESDRLDILVMNAGLLPGGYEETINGWESSLQVNHLGTSLLSLLLLPCLVDTGKKFGSTSRLVLVASGVHYWVILPDDIKRSSNPIARLSGPSYRDPLSMRRRYLETKLLNVLFARALQSQLQSNTPLTVNSVNPGLCYSNLRRNIQGIYLNLRMTIREILLAWTSEKGSRQLIYAAIGENDNEERMKGAYMSNTTVSEPSDFVISEEGKKMQDAVLKESIEILSKEAPQLVPIVQGYLI